MNNYLNPVSVSLHFIAYACFCISAFKLHKDLSKHTGAYPIGASEALIFMCVPFFYIFWNAYWVEKACRVAFVASSRFPRLFGLHLQTWLIAFASPMIFPDNMDRVSPLFSIPLFIVALAISEGMRRKLKGEIDASAAGATAQ